MRKHHGVASPSCGACHALSFSLSVRLTITRCGVATAASYHRLHSRKHRRRSARPSPAGRIVLLRALSLNTHVRTRAPSGREAATGRVDTCDRRYQTWPPVNVPLHPPEPSRQQKTRYTTRSASRFCRGRVVKTRDTPTTVAVDGVHGMITVGTCRVVDRKREICYDSTPPKSRATRVARVKVSRVQPRELGSSPTSICLTD